MQFLLTDPPTHLEGLLKELLKDVKPLLNLLDVFLVPEVGARGHPAVVHRVEGLENWVIYAKIKANTVNKVRSQIVHIMKSTI